ncbi:hypothetical protein ACFMQL_33265 [Nonomuraea fastidiosa]|uniref:hypothetical protein n=1 Tax=Nonomuraea TaxID=83681 RepID=UPI00341324E7
MVSLVLLGAIAGLILGDDVLWVAVEWSPPPYIGFFHRSPYGLAVVTALLAAAPVKAAALWIILRPPEPGPLSGRERALRLLLYLAVADGLVLWAPISWISDAAGAAFQLALWAAIDTLLLLVIRWRSRVLRAVAGVMFACELALAVVDLLGSLGLTDAGYGTVYTVGSIVAALATTALTVAGQWRDGRWSRGTLGAGWLSTVSVASAYPVFFVGGSDFEGPLVWIVVTDVIRLTGALYLAATAREMPVAPVPSASGRRSRGRAYRAAVAALALLPIAVLVQPEEHARRTFTGAAEDCYDRPESGDLDPARREAVFLCLAREGSQGTPPMFPDSMPDQAILAYGRALCRTQDPAKQQALLREAGSPRAEWGADPWDLVYVCPEIVGKTHPDLLRSSEERKQAEIDYVAEHNATCRDPWPRTKGVVQATAYYFLFVDGDPGYLVYDPADEQGEGEDRTMDELYQKGNKTGLGVTPTAVLVGHVADVTGLCLTVKAFRKAPPPRTGGWDTVHEVPITTRGGRLTVPEMDGGEVGAGAPMPNLAINGKGRYRLRVYVRVTRGGEEEHLVVVYPGSSRKRLDLKSLYGRRNSRAQGQD